MSETVGNLSCVTLSYKWVVGFPGPCEKVEYYLLSPIYSASVNNIVHICQLILWPNDKSDEDFVTIALRNFSTNTFEAKIILAVLNGENEVVHTYTAPKRTFSSNYVTVVCKEFIKLDFVLNPVNGLLIDDKLTFLCKVIFNEHDNCVSLGRLKEFDDFERLLDNENHSDVIFTAEGKTIRAHKCVLANRSEVFAAMFEHGQQNTVEIKDVSYDAFKEMLRFIYSGKVNETEIDMVDLFLVADKYLLKTLKKTCEIKLCEYLNSDNAIEYLSIADTYNAKLLQPLAIKFILLDAENLMNRPEFEKFSETHPKIMCRILRDLASMKIKGKQKSF